MPSGQVTMMGAGVRVAAASTVLLGGVLVALLFRHESSPTNLLPAETGERLVLRRPLEPRRLSEVISRHNAARGGPTAWALGASLAPAGEPAARKPTILKPLSPAEPPPMLARDYPGDVALDPQDWTSPPGQHSPGAKVDGKSPRVHKIADGDTLRSLAERYLGSADRFLEIYEANRGLLVSSEILPIGVELQIPLRPRQSPSPSNFMPKRPLVPVSDGEDET